MPTPARRPCGRRPLAVLALAPALAALGALAIAWCPAARAAEDRDQWQQPDRVVAEMALRPGDALADIGCGSGYFTFRLAKAVGDKGKVYATEISKEALKPVADRVKNGGAANIAPVLSGPTDTKLTDACLDAAVVINVIHHVPQEQRAPLVKDVVRAVKPGGVLFLVDWRVDAKTKQDLNLRIPKEDLLKLAAGAGLVLEAEYFYLENQVFFRFRKPA